MGDMLKWGLAALLVLGVVGAAFMLLQGPSTSGSAVDAKSGDGTWSYYHDTDYDAGSDSAKWSSDRSRSSDPDEAVLGDTSRWDYEGPYKYGSYGSDGMRRRASGRDSADPLYSQPDAVPDVFDEYGGDLDPSGGKPVGSAPSSMTNPYFNPYGGYSNPYANRIRLAYGEGVGRGASYSP